MKHARAVVGVLLAVVLAAVLSGCAPEAQRPKTTTFAPQPTTGLAALLEAPPAGSGAGTSSWAGNYSPAVEQYVDYLYAADARDRIRARLDSQGLREVAHVLWITDDEIQNDVVLLRFDDSAGGSAHYDFDDSTADEDPGLASYRLDTAGAPVVYYDKKPRKGGFTLAKTYARIDSYVVEMFTYAPSVLPRSRIQEWVGDQVDRLS